MSDATEAQPAPPPQDLIVKFERIGRTGTAPEAALTVHVPANIAADPDRIADMLYTHCRWYVLPRWFSVDVDLDAGTVTIDGGRHGRGTIRDYGETKAGDQGGVE